MPAYVYINFEVLDSERQADLMPRFSEALATADGELVFVGRSVQSLEGAADHRPFAGLLKFADVAAARAFYDSDEYAPLRAERRKIQRADMLLIEAF